MTRPPDPALLDLWRNADRRLQKARSSMRPERVHQARVAIRRLRTALVGATGVKEIDRLDDDLKRTFRSLAVLRDADILIGHLEELGGGAVEPVDAVIAELVKRLKRERKDARKTANKAIDRFARRHSPKKTRRLLKSIASVDPSDRTERGDALRLAVLGFDDAVRTDGDSEQLHEARKAVKRWRYHLEAESGETDDAVVAGLTRIQGALGEVHDLDALIALLSAEVERHGDSAIASSLKRMLASVRRKRTNLRKQANAAWSDLFDV